NKFTAPFFSIYPAVSPPLGVRWEPDATLRFASLTQHVLPQTPARHKESKVAGFSSPSYFALASLRRSLSPFNEPFTHNYYFFGNKYEYCFKKVT
ncbi:MAG: hypothetical protein RR553_03690, partial [Akkermansia sp.]